MLRTMLVLGLLLTGAACSRAAPGEAEPEQAPVRVEVVNNYALAMEVYASGRGISQRLGVVHPGLTADFVVSRNVVLSGGVVFEAFVDVSSPRFRSQSLLLAPGSTVDFVIAAVLFNSTVTIRP